MRPSALLRSTVVGMAVLYLGLLVGFTVVFADPVPTAAWVGFGVIAAMATALVIGTIRLFERSEATAGMDRRADAVPAHDGRHRVLVVADVGCEGSDVCPLIVERARSKSNTQVLVVAPTIASPFHHLMDDEGTERFSAGRRLDEIVSTLEYNGVEAQGMIGSDLPLQAIQDALAVFSADEIVVVAPSSETSGWSERDLVDRARSAHGRPVTHLELSRATR
jgi:hypothetical protein